MVDRYGFRRSLMLCFSIFAVGYLIVGLAGLPVTQPLVAVVGVRAWTLTGLRRGDRWLADQALHRRDLRPHDHRRQQGARLLIYYSMVNVGGMLGPTLAVPIRENLGIAYVLVVASACRPCCARPHFLFFREPPRPADLPPTKTMAEVLAGMLRALTDVRFVVFLVIFSGFWLMFWHIFYALPFYVKDVLHYRASSWSKRSDRGRSCC